MSRKGLGPKSETGSDVRSVINSLYDAYYEQGDRTRSVRLAERLAGILDRGDPGDESILGAEGRSLIAEVEGRLSSAIDYRIETVRRIQKLWKSARTAEQAEYFQTVHGPACVSGHLDLLAILYFESGQLRKAVRTLWKSRELCEEHGIKFEGAALLKDYLKELRASAR